MNVLSVQSHVVHGHVGNSAAVFPLQRMGHDVWPLHVLQYSNHPGYGDFGGSGFDRAHLESVVDGLDRRGCLATCDAVLSGYVGSTDGVDAVAGLVERIRSRNPSVLYCCDPAFGDIETGAFVPEAVIERTAQALVPRADVVRANTFELERLTGGCVDSDPVRVLTAARALQKELVVVTGISSGEQCIAALAATVNEEWIGTTQKLDLGRRPDGAGDLFTALFLGVYLSSHDVGQALAHAMSATYSVLRETRDGGSRELALVKAQAALADPTSKCEISRLC